MWDAQRGVARERFWATAGRVVSGWGVTANQITVASTLGVLAACAAYPFHESPLLLAGCIAVFEELDNLDGAVARASGTASHYGAYLDALTDRYKDVALLVILALVHDLWPAALLAAIGSLLTSYAKARAGMEVPIDNHGWPDLFERTERIVLIVVGLLAQSAIGTGGALGSFTPWGLEPIALALWALVVGTHLTALQRGWRALSILGEA